MMRGLLLVEMIRPKLPALRTCPVVGSLFPPDATKAFRLLMGLAKLGWLHRLKNSVPDSNIGKYFARAKSKSACCGRISKNEVGRELHGARTRGERGRTKGREARIL